MLSSDKTDSSGIVSKKLFSYELLDTAEGKGLKAACNSVSY